MRLEKDARTWLDRQGVDVLSTQLVRSADMCFEGQSFEMNICFPNDFRLMFQTSKVGFVSITN